MMLQNSGLARLALWIFTHFFWHYHCPLFQLLTGVWLLSGASVAKPAGLGWTDGPHVVAWAVSLRLAGRNRQQYTVLHHRILVSRGLHVRHSRLSYSSKGFSVLGHSHMHRLRQVVEHGHGLGCGVCNPTPYIAPCPTVGFQWYTVCAEPRSPDDLRSSVCLKTFLHSGFCEVAFAVVCTILGVEQESNFTWSTHV